MENLYLTYLTAWSLTCLAALITFLRDRSAYALCHPEYRRFLCVPWKLGTLFIAGVGMTVIAPYTGDPTWDYIDASVMSLMTFLTAPWVVGVLYKAFVKKMFIRQTFVAVTLWLFSASWSYDLYLLIRDGYYPTTWWPNLCLSSVLYISGGLLWSLEYLEGKGVVFSFMRDDWPVPPGQGSFYNIFWLAVPFMLIAGVMILAFLVRW